MSKAVSSAEFDEMVVYDAAAAIVERAIACSPMVDVPLP